MKKNSEDKSWSFLVASPELDTPAFDESVVLVLEDNSGGAFGVILNKPTGRFLYEVESGFAKFKELSQVELYDGGPIAKDRISIAVWYDDGSDLGNFSFGIAPEKAEEILLQKPNAQAAVFQGYSGWGPKQLDTEIEEGSWIMADADLGMLSDLSPEELWEELLIRNNPIFEKFPQNPCGANSRN